MRLRALTEWLRSSGFSPQDGPLVREGLLRRAWPFLVAAIVARVMLWLPGSAVTDRPILYAAGASTLLLVGCPSGFRGSCRSRSWVSSR